MPTIRIDDEVYRYLQGRAEPFTDNPNSVLRRLFDLDPDPATPEESIDRPAGWTPKRYLDGRVVLITEPRATGPDRTYIESGIQSDRGADLNQVQTELARRLGRRNPEVRKALDALIAGAADVTVGEYRLQVRYKANAMPAGRPR